VHLHRLGQHLELRVISLVRRAHLAKFRDQHFRNVVLFFRFVDEIVRVALAAHRRVEDLFFQLRVHRQFNERRLDELLFHLPFFRALELTEDVFHPSVVFTQNL